jgi:GTPase SAR1 family protein
VDPWVTPSINLTITAFKNRKAIAKAWDRAARRVGGRGFRFVVAGEPGVGKSVLMDHLSGDAFAAKYKPPGTSPNIEKDSRRVHRNRYRFEVVPGQAAHRDRISDLSKTLKAKEGPDGVIYVVANGLHELRSTLVEDQIAMAAFDDLSSYQANRREAELNGLVETLKIMRETIREKRRPSWLILAVNKADLFGSQTELDGAKTHYLSSGSPFRQAVDEFRAQVGADNLLWSCVPTCSWLEPFRFGATDVRPQFSPEQRNAMLAGLMGTVEQLSLGRE